MKYLFLVIISFHSAFSQDNLVTVDVSIQRFIGDISELDRSKYFLIHTPANTPLLQDFYEEYNVEWSGRGFYGPGIEAKKQKGEVGIYPKTKIKKSEKVKSVRRYVSTEHPRNLYKEGIDIDALSDWAVEYFKNVDDEQRPLWYEPMNEPFVHAKDFYDEKDWDPVAEVRVKTEMSKMYRAIAAKIHAEPSLKKMKIMGYGAAWPSFELKDFKNWETNMGLFLDIAGDEMDAISYHLYDGVNQAGQNNKRSGSNNEAIMDMIESYSFNRWGYVKPHAITEYGGIEKNEFSLIRNMQSIRSQNAMIFGLLDRQDRLEVSIPFTTDNATWHITEKNNYMPYKAVLWRAENMGVPKKEITGWVYTNRIHFYQLWKDIKGNRVFSNSNNPDVQVQSFIHDKQLFIALNNLDDNPQKISLNTIGIQQNIESINVKSLTVFRDDFPRYYEDTISILPTEFFIDKDETIVLTYNLKKRPGFKGKVKELRYYSKEFLLPIKAHQKMTFTFRDITANPSSASLSMGIGRMHDQSKRPIIEVNGKKIEIPFNWEGYDQKNRKKFFGVIEVPIPPNLLKETNVVHITFPDSGGHLSTLILDVDEFESFKN